MRVAARLARSKRIGGVDSESTVEGNGGYGDGAVADHTVVARPGDLSKPVGDTVVELHDAAVLAFGAVEGHGHGVSGYGDPMHVATRVRGDRCGEIDAPEPRTRQRLGERPWMRGSCGLNGSALSLIA